MLSHSTEVTSFILLFSEATSAISFDKRNLGNKLVDARNNLIHGAVLRLTGFEKCPSWFFNGNSSHYNLVL